MACGVGTLFVAPYIQATYTELYEVLKYKVISSGMAGTDELGGPNGYMGEEERGYHSYHATPNSTENGARMYDSAPSCPSQNHSPTGFPKNLKIRSLLHRIPFSKKLMKIRPGLNNR